MTDLTDVVVVGAGLAGLACARHLTRAGLRVALLDAADAPGGRVRTDVVEGFRLDRGFQVFQTAYPEAKAVFDYDRLRLGPFRPGALVRAGGRFHRVVDPFRDPLGAPATLAAPVGTLADKFRLARLQMAVCAPPLDTLFGRPEVPIHEALATRYGFGPSLTERFFRPFFGGITLDPGLGASSRFFEFAFRMFAEGEGALPADGMEALPRGLADALPAGTLRLDTRVAALDGTAAVLEGRGARVEGRALVVATAAPDAERLVPGAATTLDGRGEACLYFAAPTAPFADALLVLNGDGEGPINNLSVVSNAQPTYAPEGQALVSVVVLGEAAALAPAAREAAVRRQLAAWYGPVVAGWRHLRTYDIAYGLPDQAPPFLTPRDKPVRLGEGRYRCGDHVETASINGALRSGRLAAEAVRVDLAA